MKSLHIICAKCGSEEIETLIRTPNTETCGVCFVCRDCSTMTWPEELQEYYKERYEKNR